MRSFISIGSIVVLLFVASGCSKQSIPDPLPVTASPAPVAQEEIEASPSPTPGEMEKTSNPEIQQDETTPIDISRKEEHEGVQSSKATSIKVKVGRVKPIPDRAPSRNDDDIRICDRVRHESGRAHVYVSSLRGLEGTVYCKDSKKRVFFQLGEFNDCPSPGSDSEQMIKNKIDQVCAI